MDTLEHLEERWLRGHVDGQIGSVTKLGWLAFRVNDDDEGGHRYVVVTDHRSFTHYEEFESPDDLAACWNVLKVLARRKRARGLIHAPVIHRLGELTKRHT